ncbi:TetR family transcriptional regulator, partial [Streptomyces hainanensis]
GGGGVGAARPPRVRRPAGLLAMGNGLGSSVWGGQRDGDVALAILTHHLDELFRSP